MTVHDLDTCWEVVYQMTEGANFDRYDQMRWLLAADNIPGLDMELTLVGNYEQRLSY